MIRTSNNLQLFTHDQFSLTILAVIIYLTPSLALAETSEWKQWMMNLKNEAIEEGIRPETLDKALKDVKPSKQIIKLDQSQTKRRISFTKYRNKKIDPYTINKGKRLMKQHYKLLHNIEQTYSVNKCLIITLWGMESAYGYYKGRFPVIDALATLAYDPRRGEFFRSELMYALMMVDNHHIKLEDFKGEWAGGSGHPQFLPSTWYHYSVDHNLDGKKDIWNTLPDVFASMANFMQQNGWRNDQPWGVEVKFPSYLDESLRGLEKEQKKSVQAWRSIGVKIPKNKKHEHLKGWVIKLQDGPTLLVFDNFKALRKWNRSLFYSATAGYLSEKICQ
ncbi:MAG TPA: lytic murein transglycosylase [Gammaproteobacteria bacterium]|nr:lytic murein transglycosylase [Gammaproteobacteria bacterium]